MIYLVSNQQELFNSEYYKMLTVDESLNLIEDWVLTQVDTETTGLDAHLDKILSLQLGNDHTDTRIVIDAVTVDIRVYKPFLETHFLILHNGIFDLQFFYELGIIPLKVYDTMIVEQFLHLGYDLKLSLTPVEYEKRNCNYPYHIVEKENKKTKEVKTVYKISYALDAVAKHRLGITIDKSIRGQIIYLGLNTQTILYGAGDVTWLEKIMHSQLRDIKKIPNALTGARIECDFVPCVAYLIWCGIKLDETKWKAKMLKDEENLSNSLKALNTYCLNHPKLQKFVVQDIQLSLFEEVSPEPYFNIDWQKDEAKKVFKILGFNLDTISKTTGEETESVTEKLLATQKGVDDEFLKLYLTYQGYFKVITSFGQGHLNAINPVTRRLHTNYRAIGTISGRMSSGSSQINPTLSRIKKVKCGYPNMQQLPHDAETRGCFIAEEGNDFISCDYSAKLNFPLI